MSRLLERLGSFAARRPWIMFVAWVVILGGLLGARQAFGGTYVNNYNISGSNSEDGLNRLNSTFSSQGGYGGQIVYHAAHGTVAAQKSAVNQASANVAKLPDVIKSVSPFSTAGAGAVSKNGTIAYTSVSWSVNPYSLDTSYLTKLNNATAPARKAGLQVEYGSGAGNIGNVYIGFVGMNKATGFNLLVTIVPGGPDYSVTNPAGSNAYSLESYVIDADNAGDGVYGSSDQN